MLFCIHKAKWCFEDTALEVTKLSEKEINDMTAIAEAYKELPPYLRGKIDGYAEAIKERGSADEEERPA